MQIMKKLLYIYSLLFAAYNGFAQTVPSPTENYILSTTYLTEDKSKKTETIKYLDGLGRPKQVIDVKAAVSGKDLVVPIEYDDFGRQVRSYLPLPVNSLSGAIHPVEGADVNSHYGVLNAYSESVLEDSRLNRIKQSASPGNDWIKDTNTVKYDYDTNTIVKDGAIKQYITSTSWSENIVYTTFTVSSYPEFQLYKTIIKDEDNNETHLFKNKKGQTVLVRKINSDINNLPQNIDTYYVYNKYNQLAYIIPPLAAEKSVLEQEDMDELCYQYRYDEKGRLAEKKLPGKGLDSDTGIWHWELMVYDNQDRLVMSQDANLKKQEQWLFTKYDKYSRVAYTGITSNSGSRSSIQTILNGKGNNNVARTSSSGFTAPGLLVYYDNLPANNYPNSFTSILTVNYYDTYPPGSPVVTNPILNQEILQHNAQNSIISTKSLPTASFVKNIDNNAWTKTYVWYDTKARPVGSHTINHLDGYTKTETLLDFVGIPEKTITYHSRSYTAQPDVTIEENFTYDDRKRLIKHEHEVMGKSPKEILAEYTYNDREKLVEKKVGNNIQQVDYRYNIRGWLTGINLDESDEPQTGKLFNYRIKYNNPEKPSLSPPKYNGNIAEIDWWNNGSAQKRYGYQYDKLNRLLAGIYQDPESTTPESRINDELVTYDLNGNIKTLKRNTKQNFSYTPILIDNLTYTYTGNRVTNIDDLSGNMSGYEGGNGLIEYDQNGNMTTMPDKGISAITYNFLNLPTQINQNTNTINYFYRADGVKIKKKYTLVNASGTKTINTEYLGGFQYSTLNIDPIRRALEEQDEATELAATAGQPETFSPLFDRAVIGGPGEPIDPNAVILSFFPTAEGYYDYENLRYIYQYKDQVGNIRISYVKENDELKIMSTNEFYPFGMSFLNKTGFATTYDPLAIPYNYKFQEQELQETGFYSFKWRQYMPDVGRFFNVDPLSEKYAYQSHYNFSENRVVNSREIEGLEAWDNYEPSRFEDRDYDGGIDYTNREETGITMIDLSWKVQDTSFRADMEEENKFDLGNFWDDLYRIASDFFNDIFGNISLDNRETFYNFSGGFNTPDTSDNIWLRPGDKVERSDLLEILYGIYGNSGNPTPKNLAPWAERLGNFSDAIDKVSTFKENFLDKGKTNDTLIYVEWNAQYPFGENGIRLKDTIKLMTVEKNDRNEYEYRNNPAIREAIDAAQNEIKKKTGR